MNHDGTIDNQSHVVKLPAIVDAQVYAVAIPRIYKTRVSSMGGLGEGKTGSLYYLFELVADNGLRGIGEISDMEDDWNIPLVADFTNFLRQQLCGSQLEQRRTTVQDFRNNLPVEWHHEMRTMMTTAVDMALLDLLGKTLGVPLYELLGGRCRQNVVVSWVAFIRKAELLEHEIREKVEQGFNAFKLKVGDDFRTDYENVEAIRRVAGPQAYLKLDASGAWDGREAIEHIKTLSRLKVDAVETPLRDVSRSLAKFHPERVNDDPERAAQALAAVRQAVAPVKIIEHISDFSDGFAMALIKHRAVDIFNVLIPQAGSMERTLRLARLAETAGIEVLLGSTVELGPGTAFALHAAAVCPGITAPSDLVGPGLLVDDVITEPFRYASSTLRVPDGPGLGVSLDGGKLLKHRKEL
jgi:muconate cycloisomerase